MKQVTAVAWPMMTVLRQLPPSRMPLARWLKIVMMHLETSPRSAIQSVLAQSTAMTSSEESSPTRMRQGKPLAIPMMPSVKNWQKPSAIAPLAILTTLLETWQLSPTQINQVFPTLMMLWEMSSPLQMLRVRKPATTIPAPAASCLQKTHSETPPAWATTRTVTIALWPMRRATQPPQSIMVKTKSVKSQMDLAIAHNLPTIRWSFWRKSQMPSVGKPSIPIMNLATQSQ